MSGRRDRSASVGWCCFVFILLSLQEVSSRTCPAGTHFASYYNGISDTCVPCPDNSFMSSVNHQEEWCKMCEEIQDPELEIVVSPCNKTHDAVIHRVDGYYRDLANTRLVGDPYCTKSNTTDVQCTGRTSGNTEDTASCPDPNMGMVDVPESNGNASMRPLNTNSQAVPEENYFFGSPMCATLVNDFVIEIDNDVSNEAQPITGGQSQGNTAQEPKRKKAKSRPAPASERPTPIEEESESDLHKKWLRSAIEKNRVQTEVAHLKKQKLLLEIHALTKQNLDSLDHGTSNETE